MHDTIGFDLVGMVVDDLVVCGAEPLFMTDYIASARSCPSGSPRSSRASPRPASQAGCALVGGETAEHPGLLGPDEYDVAGAATGVVEADRPARPGPGRAPATWSSRWRRAGCTPTATRWCATCCSTRPAGRSTAHVAELGRTLGEELLEPTRIYAKACLDLAREHRRRTRCRHVTGGGLAANLARVLPDRAARDRRPRTWTPAPVFDLVRRGRRRRAARTSSATLNCGVGMVAVLAPDDGRPRGRAAGRARGAGLGRAAR